MTERAVIYCRVSTDVQRDNFSIPSQVRACMEYAKTRRYAVLGDWYVDAETGKDATRETGIPAFVDDISSSEEDRPALTAARLFLKRQGFEVLIVHSLDRLARGPGLLEVFEALFSEGGARVEYVLGGYERSPEGDVLKGVVASMARYENVKRVERSTRGKLEKVRRGLFVGRPSYGYRADDQGIGGVVIEPGQAETVREVFRLFTSEGHSIRGLVEELNARGIPPYFGGKWGKSSLQRMLWNRWYIGEAFYNKHRRARKKLLLRPEGEWVKVEVPSIISRETFKEAQDLLAQNRDTRRRRPLRFYLLSGMVFCAECGRPYVAQAALAGRGRRKVDARSYRHRAKDGACKNEQISAAVLEEAAMDGFVKVIFDPALLEKAWRKYVRSQDSGKVEVEAKLRAIEKASSKVHEKRARLLDLYEDGGIAREELSERIRQRDAELAELNEEGAKAAARLSDLPSEEEFEDVKSYAAGLAGDFLTMSQTELRDFMRRLKARVQVKPGERKAIVRLWVPSGLSSRSHL